MEEINCYKERECTYVYMYICLCVYMKTIPCGSFESATIYLVYFALPSFVPALSSLNQVPINSGALCKYLFRTLLKTLIKRRLSSYRSSNEPRLFSISNRLVVWHDDNPDFIFTHELNRAPQLLICSLISLCHFMCDVQHVAKRWEKEEDFFMCIHKNFLLLKLRKCKILKLDACLFFVSREQIWYIDHTLCLVSHLLNYLARRLLFIRLDIRLNRLSDHSPAYIDVVFYLNANLT